MKRLVPILLLILSTQLLFGQQIPNMNFDSWSKRGVTWYPYAKGASESQKAWASANPGLKPLGTNATMPEYKHVAVAGPGKAAAKLVSKKVLWAFLTGNLFTGSFARVVKFSGAEMYYGVPFHGRPKSITGYFHYIPGTINYAKAPYLAMKGKQDEGMIDVALYGWKKPLRFISTDGPSKPATEDPDLIGLATLVLDKSTDGYVPFEIKIDYRSNATPSYVFISVIASRLGEFFTGSGDTVLYVDEFRFNY